MAYRGVSYFFLILLGTTVFAADLERESLYVPQDQAGSSSFYIKYPFIDLASWLEDSDELQRQYEELSDEDKQLLFDLFDQFNDHFQQAFHAMIAEEASDEAPFSPPNISL